MSNSRGKLVQRVRVPLGFLLAAATLYFARPTPASLIAGGLIALIGLAVRAWAAGHIHKNSEVTMSGPYAYTRNPLYLGSLILGVGFLIAAAQPILIVLFALLFFGIYLPVMQVEAQSLIKSFGDDYARYMKHVPLLLPRLTRYKDSAQITVTAEAASPARFDKNLYLRYREYQAALGLIAALAVLFIKMRFAIY